MEWRSAPPLNGKLIGNTRLRKCMTQLDVARQCAALGVSIHPATLSRIENGDTKRPLPRLVPVLAQVLGLEVDDMFTTAGEGAEPDGAAA